LATATVRRPEPMGLAQGFPGQAPFTGLRGVGRESG
jgi:hypothetical protein